VRVCSLRSFSIGIALILVGFALLAPAPMAAAEEENLIPVSESGSATAQMNGATFSVSYSITPLGTLISLQPLVSRLGGELEIGPLGQSHRLSVAATEYIFGPDSAAVTVSEEIISLSQPPKLGAGGLQVPIDLLEEMYGAGLGYEFDWIAPERRLALSQRQMRVVPLSVELVNLQGVSTLVLRFRDEPRYRIDEQPGSVIVEMLGDRASLTPGQQLAPDPLVSGVHVTEEKITIDLASGAESEHYTLDDGRRLVFEIFQGAPTKIEISGSSPPTTPDRGRKMETIVIDPGHGGRDSGTLGKGGLNEKDLTLTLARSLKSTLERLYPIRVVLTRSEDAYLPLETRTAIANQHDADLFLSLHLNASRGSNASGAETFFLSLQATDESAALLAGAENAFGGATSADSDLDLILWNLAQNRHLGQSQNLAKMIQTELNERMGIANRGVKQAPFRVLMGARMPAVLVEVGFLSNDDEARRLATSEYQNQLVEGLAEAIGRYRETVRPAPTPGEPVQAARAPGEAP